MKERTTNILGFSLGIAGLIFFTIGMEMLEPYVLGQEVDLKCLAVNDGRVAIVDIQRENGITIGSWGECEGHEKTIAYFLNQGYNITGIAFDKEIYLTK